MLLTNEERQMVFNEDTKKIKQYLIDRFNLDNSDPECIYFVSTALEMKYVILPDKDELSRLDAKQLADELITFNSEMWSKLRMFSIRSFSVYNGKLNVEIDYKSNIEVITIPKANCETALLN